MLIRMLTNISYIVEQRDPVVSEKVSGWLKSLQRD
jgi:hypothetical protein